jgi:ornithine carbamoyltransferase
MIVLQLTDEEVNKLQTEYNVDYASCIGSLIYLSMTRCDTIYAINKLAKYSKHPSRNHFTALFHLLRYL